MADRFTADKMAWIETVLMSRHDALTPFARVVGVMIGQHLNRVAGYAYPSVADLSAILGATEKGVRGAVQSLEKAGLLKVERTAGRALHNRYFLAGADHDQPLQHWYDAKRKTPPAGADKEAEKPHLPGQKTPPAGSGNPHPPVLYNPLSKPIDENPVCVAATHKKAFQDEGEALAYVRELITKAAVEAEPRKVLLACQSHHGDAWQAKLHTWTLGAIARSAEKPKPIVPIYDGPPELRADALQMGGTRLAAYVDHYCRWREEDRTLLCRSATTAKIIADQMGKRWLDDRAISIGVMPANDVPITAPKGRQSWC